MYVDDKKRANRSMAIRALLCVGLLGPCCGALAQQQAAPEVPPASEEAQDRTYLGNERIESCMQRWDPGTHMTKEAWRASCERIKAEREPYTKGR